ncbi:MAG: hypothetical protein M1826_002079 [Phylliscum demangeonii]|nr:MAG: hypothetical protein M1826_002079 [Phylliscum demangeonii]
MATTTTTTTNTTTTTTTTTAAKRQRCTFKDCKDAAQRIVGDCGFCSGQFCGKHRLLEDHKCAGLEDCKKESHDANADKLIAERTTVIKGI